MKTFAHGHRTGNGQFYSDPKKGKCQSMFKLLYNCTHFMFKILQARLQQYVNWGLPDIQARFRKGKGTRDQIANIHWIIEKAREFQKNIFPFHWLRESLCVDHNKHSVHQFSCSVMSNPWGHHGLQHARLPCLSPTSGAYSKSCPFSRWWHPTISSSIIPFSSCPQSLPASGSFPMSQLFA